MQHDDITGGFVADIDINFSAKQGVEISDHHL